MRLSVNPQDRGYRTYRALPKRVLAVVTVNGAEIPRCVTADDRLGYAVAIEADTEGRVLLTARRDSVKLKQLRGVVRIELRRR